MLYYFSSCRGAVAVVSLAFLGPPASWQDLRDDFEVDGVGKGVPR